MSSCLEADVFAPVDRDVVFIMITSALHPPVANDSLNTKCHTKSSGGTFFIGIPSGIRWRLI